MKWWHNWTNTKLKLLTVTLSYKHLVIKFSINTLRARQIGHHFPDIFKWIFLKENVWISIEISLKFVPKGPISNIPALVQIMAWCRPGNKPWSPPFMISLLMHICITRPQWVKQHKTNDDPLHWHTFASVGQEMLHKGICQISQSQEFKQI